MYFLPFLKVCHFSVQCLSICNGDYQVPPKGPVLKCVVLGGGGGIFVQLWSLILKNVLMVY